MKTIKVRWRLYTNLVLLSAMLITSFQNCTRVETTQKAPKIPAGVEVVLE